MKRKADRRLNSLEEAVDREVERQLPRHRDANGAIASTPVAAVTPKSAPRKWRLRLILLLCLVGSSVISFVVFKYVAPTIPRDLVGTWQVTQGPMKGATLEFRWYGTVIATSTDKQGKKEITDSSVKVDGNTIFMTTKHAVTGKDDTVKQSILKLTDDELVLRDEDRITYSLVRVRK